MEHCDKPLDYGVTYVQIKPYKTVTHESTICWGFAKIESYIYIYDSTMCEAPESFGLYPALV